MPHGALRTWRCSRRSGARLEECGQLIARGIEPAAEGVDGGEGQQAPVEPRAEPAPARRLAAIDVVGEPVAAGMLESLAREVAAAERGIEGQGEHASLAQQRP